MSKHQKRHKNYRKFLEWKAQRDKDNKELFMVSREIKTLDSKYNDYNGQFQGRVLNVEQWGKYGVVSNPDGFGRIMEYPNKRFVLMTEERYYKEFCQLDHMINDRAYMRYCREFVSTSQTTKVRGIDSPTRIFSDEQNLPRDLIPDNFCSLILSWRS